VAGHFGGEPGILASMRLKDRTAPGDMGYTLVNMKSGNKSGHYSTEEEALAAMQNMPESMRPMLSIKRTRGPNKKLLHLEELQSDWHQRGREKGYKEPFSEEDNLRYKDLYDKHFGKGETYLNPEELKEFQLLDKKRDLDLYGVPDAPFKKNWEEMALKRLIHHAAENGYHGVVVTPGKEQADRYGLAKHVGMVSYHPGEKRFQAFKHNRETVINEKDASPDRVAELIGKEAAQRLLAAPKVGDHHFLEGEDLNIGGEGMKGFYDKKVPNILNGIGKKYGVKTELGGHKLPGDPSQRGDASERLGLAGERLADMSPEQVQAFNQKLDDANAKQLHYFPINEAMRQDVKKNGIPLYKSGGTVSTH